MTVLFLFSLFIALWAFGQSILIGHDRDSKKPIRIPVSAFDTHFHLIGATGKGKTVAIKTMLHALLSRPGDRSCYIIIDRMGGFSFDLLRWMATNAPRFVRERLVYIEAANESNIIGFNPLVYSTPAQGYYKVSRATEIILRAWESSDIGSMPRLARWCFNCFYAAAHLKLNIADCVHFLLPFSDLHGRLLSCLPAPLQAEWREILRAGGRVIEIFDSTRNRLKPWFEMPILQQMFSVTRNRLDVLSWMQQGRIVIVNLAPQGRVPEQIADALGGLILNEVLSVARSLPASVRYNSYLVLDEFQRFVGPDMEAAMAEVRQLGVKLVLSHQSFSQLKRGDYDLTSLIWQPQTRLAFGVQGEDADILAHEFASQEYDARKIKEEIWHRKQLLSGHRIIELASRSNTETLARQWSEMYGMNSAKFESSVNGHIVGEGQSRGDNKNRGLGGSESRSNGQGSHEALLPEFEKFMELASRTFFSFDEQKFEWARDIRKHKTGQSIMRIVDDDTLYKINVHMSAPGSLALDWATVLQKLPRVADEVARLLEENFKQDCFVSPALVERETQERLDNVLRAPIVIDTHHEVAHDDAPSGDDDNNPMD